jgi:hypothetical protein
VPFLPDSPQRSTAVLLAIPAQLSDNLSDPLHSYVSL